MTALPHPPLLLITDRKRAIRPLETIARDAFAAGCRWLSVRDKDLSGAERAALVGALQSAAEPWGALVGVHGDAEFPVGAVHLPRNGDVRCLRARMPAGCLVGISAHDAGELESATRAGADYATLSPVFETASKPGAPALGLERFARLARDAPLPVLALGGLDAHTVRGCMAAGAHGIAVIGSVMAARDTGAAVAELIEALDDAAGRNRTPRHHAS